MPNYYEMLQVTPTSTTAEIETAYETQYNQWRRLVTHHDPNVVNQANQALQTLETIHATLTDPAKRAGYDAGLGLGGATGGLADPSAMLQALQRSPTPPAPMTPAPPTTAQATAAPATTVGLWLCGKCGTDNPAQTKFCFKCGNQLVRQCPECHKETSLIATGMCGECGYSYEAATHRMQTRTELATLQTSIGVAQKHLQEVSSGSSVAGFGCGGIVLVTGLALLGSSVGVGLFVLLAGGGVLFLAYSSSTQRKGKIDTANQNIQQLQGRQHQLQAELSGTTLNIPSIVPHKQPQGATIVFNSGNNGWNCSSCGGFVRRDAESCKHCQAPFIK